MVINSTFQPVAARLKSLVFPPHAVRGSTLYAASTLVAAVGRGLWLPFSLLYFHLVVGLPLALVGAGLTGAGIVGLLLTPVAGSLVDHFGARPLFIVSFAGVGVGSLVYLGAHSFSLFLVGAIVISSAYSFNMPAGTAYVAEGVVFHPENSAPKPAGLSSACVVPPGGPQLVVWLRPIGNESWFECRCAPVRLGRQCRRDRCVPLAPIRERTRLLRHRCAYPGHPIESLPKGSVEADRETIELHHRPA